MEFQKSQQTNSAMDVDTESPAVDSVEANREEDFISIETELVDGISDMVLGDDDYQDDEGEEEEEGDGAGDDNDDEMEQLVTRYHISVIASKTSPAASQYVSSRTKAIQIAWHFAYKCFDELAYGFHWVEGDKIHLLRIMNPRDGWVVGVVLVEEELIAKAKS